MKPYRLLLFDRDGTLTYEERSYHRDLSALRPYPFTGAALRDLNGAGYKLTVVTNQSGIARGYYGMEEVHTLHDRLCHEWEITPSFYICPHHPNDGCQCRKPESHLLQQAMSEQKVSPEKCLMIGDSPTDYGAAQRAGTAFALVLTGRGRTTRERLPEPPAMVLDTIASLRKHLI